MKPSASPRPRFCGQTPSDSWQNHRISPGILVLTPMSHVNLMVEYQFMAVQNSWYSCVIVYIHRVSPGVWWLNHVQPCWIPIVWWVTYWFDGGNLLSQFWIFGLIKSPFSDGFLLEPKKKQGSDLATRPTADQRSDWWPMAQKLSTNGPPLVMLCSKVKHSWSSY